MKLPELEKPEKYVGLYIFDFGDHVGVGFTAEEVAELLESEKYRDGKVYKIHRAYPDGRLELKGVLAQTFELEAGMFFYSDDLETARRDFKALVNLAVRAAPPCRAKVHLGKYNDDQYVVAMIYPSEYDDRVNAWLMDGAYKTSGAGRRGDRAGPEILRSSGSDSGPAPVVRPIRDGQPNRPGAVSLHPAGGPAIVLMADYRRSERTTSFTYASSFQKEYFPGFPCRGFVVAVWGVTAAAWRR